MNLDEKVHLAIQWAADTQEAEMIQQRTPEGMQYCYDHLSFPEVVSEDELVVIDRILEILWPGKFSWNMGEVVVL